MLIIVESPAKAKTIGNILGQKVQVKASIGHIRQISNETKTSDGRKLEINGIDIDNNFQPIYQIDSDKKNVVSEIKKLAKASKEGILFATDSDREGEAISWHLAEVLGIKDKSSIKRLEFHEITKQAIFEAIKNPRPLNVKLVEAQQARQVLDKLVGYKLSPVLWSVMGNYKLSAGRVQSPALRILCEREKEIADFKSQEFWEIKGQFQTEFINKPSENWLEQKESEEKSAKDDSLFRLIKVTGQKLPEIIESRNKLEELVGNLGNISEYVVVSVVQKSEKSYTRPPFITSTLQQSASSHLGYSPKMTMQLAQRLYEGVDIDGQPTALITYMRTDSYNLSQESIQATRQFISKHYPKYLPDKAKFYKSKSRNAQEAHEAIRPTDPLRTPESLRGKVDARQLKLYELIWKQTIACQMTDEERQRVIINLQNTQKDEFTGSIAWTTHLGFKSITDLSVKEESAEKNMYREGNKRYLKNIFYSQKFTQAPSRYSPSSLIKKMEELGIGRPSTYASIISTLYDREYTEENSKTLIPTNLGMRINDILTESFSQVTSAEMTAKMEEDLDDISLGQTDYKTVLDHFWWDFKELVESKLVDLKAEKQKYRDIQTEVCCPKFGDQMVLKMGRFGEYYQNPNHLECIYPKNFREYAIELEKAHLAFDALTNGLKCEECKKDLVVRVSKKSLKSYIACPEYKVGNNHTVKSIKDIQGGSSGEDKVKFRRNYKKAVKKGIPKKAFGKSKLNKTI